MLIGSSNADIIKAILEYHDVIRKSPMQIETTKKLFTVDEYYRMAEAGIFTPDHRVELIDGEIIEMSPIGARHLGCVNRATEAFTAEFRGRAVVSVQNPLQLTNYTEPAPDVVVLKPRADFYGAKKPVAEDAFLVLEVADTTLRYDLNVKLPRYASAGIPEVWIENLVEDLLLIYRDPEGDAYRTALALRNGDSISPLAFPDVVFNVAQLLGGSEL